MCFSFLYKETSDIWHFKRTLSTYPTLLNCSGPTLTRRGITLSSSCSTSGWGEPRTTSSLLEAPSSPRAGHMTGRGSKMWVKRFTLVSFLVYVTTFTLLQALSLALEMEKEVTARMKLMIDVCSEAGAEDYHAGDWLTGTWLEEQYQGQRQLAGLINTFNNFKWVPKKSYYAWHALCQYFISLRIGCLGYSIMYQS